MIANHHAVDVQVMSVELPPPGLGVGWPAEDGKEVRPLAKLVRTLGNDGKQAVQTHDIASLIEPSGG